MNRGNAFRDAIVEYIADEFKRLGITDVTIKREVIVGYRFVGQPRKLDIVLAREGRYLGIEAKYQEGSGTAYQKLSYTLQDAKVTPIPVIIVPVIIVFAGSGIKQDMKATLITSGIGIEIEFDVDKNRVIDYKHILLQRVMIELGLDWLSIV